MLHIQGTHPIKRRHYSGWLILLYVLKSYQSYECSQVGLGTALSSRVPYTRAVIVMYVNHTSFQRALGILPLNSRREYILILHSYRQVNSGRGYLKSTTLYSHQKRYQANFACFKDKSGNWANKNNSGNIKVE